MKKKVFGIPIVLAGILLITMIGATAALLSYYGTITAESTVQQAVTFDDDTVEKKYSFDGNIVAGASFEDEFILKNHAEIPAQVELVTTGVPAQGIEYGFYKPVIYDYTESIDIAGADDLVVTVEEDGDWVVWNFTYNGLPSNDGNINAPVVIGSGDDILYQIHNNDGGCGDYDFGTWLYSEYDNGWHTGGAGCGDTNIPVTDASLDWIEASGDRHGNDPGFDGILQVKIHKDELGKEFKWASRPNVGSGWSGVPTQYFATPSAYNWGDSNTTNFHEAILAEEITGPFWLSPEETFEMFSVFDFSIALTPGTYNINTEIVPVLN